MTIEMMLLSYNGVLPVVERLGGRQNPWAGAYIFSIALSNAMATAPGFTLPHCVFCSPVLYKLLILFNRHAQPTGQIVTGLMLAFSVEPATEFTQRIHSKTVSFGLGCK